MERHLFHAVIRLTITQKGIPSVVLSRSDGLPETTGTLPGPRVDASTRPGIRLACHRGLAPEPRLRTKFDDAYELRGEENRRIAVTFLR